MILRNAVAADFKSVARLVNAAYRGILSSPGWTSETEMLEGTRITESELKKEVEGSASMRLLVAEDRGSLIGCIALRPLSETTWYFSMLAVHPEFQSRQAGRFILAEAERFVVGKGAKTMRMTVISIRKNLIDWYARRGYVATGEILPFPYDDPSVGQSVRADLTLSVFKKHLTAGETVPVL